MDQEKLLEQLKQRIQDFPSSPGVYIMKDSSGRIIYIGKAKDLRKRVSSYTMGRRDIKTRMLVSKIQDIEFIATDNEYEALLLENNLIKKWKPHYNINLKDGKSFPVIRITNEEYPRVFKTRRVINDGSEYFGPYADVSKIDLYLELIEKIYPLRKCRGKLKKRYSPCLYYHIGRCSAPCAGKISREEYAEIVEKVRVLLRGNTGELVSSLKREMHEAAQQKRFEEAARLRDAVTAVASAQVSQQVEDFLQHTRDYIACIMRDHIVSISVFQMREGKLIGQELHRGESFGDEEDSLVTFFAQYYRDPEDVPEVIYISHDTDTAMLGKMLLESTGRKSEIRQPKKGKHLRIMSMVLQNAAMDADRRLRAQENIPALEELQEILDLPNIPIRIEGFDIAHLSGKYPTASLVSFYNGNPDKRGYRKYHVKSLDGKIDDYEALREVTARRYTRLVNEKQPLPDLVLIDGGKGQVNAVREILNALGLEEVPVIGLAKEFEEIHVPGQRNPCRLPGDSPALHVLQAVRDETHRFATNFSRGLQAKDVSFSLLESVPGIGGARSRKLMQAYGSVDAIAEAGEKNLAETAGIPISLARRVIEVLGELKRKD